MKIVRLLLIFCMASAPVFAQQQSVCNKVASFIVAGAGGTTTVIAATDKQTDICGFLITADTTGTRVTIKGGTTNLTDSTGLIVGASGNIPWSYQAITWSVPSGLAVTVTCGTGACDGFLTYRN